MSDVLVERAVADGPFWLFTYDKWTFEVPYTRQLVEMDSKTCMYLTFGSACLYLLLVIFVFPLLKPGNKEKIDYISKIHYSILSAYSGFVFFAVLGWLYFSGNFDSYQSFLCDPLPDSIRIISMSFIASKVVEWFDTAVMIWSGKRLHDIGLLHVYHHSTTVFLFLLVANHPGPDKAGMVLNAGIHFLMYYHFAWKLPRVFRPVITLFQILQFITAMIFYADVPSQCPAYSEYPQKYALEHVTSYFFICPYLLLFMRFFYLNYIAVPTPTGVTAKCDQNTLKNDQVLKNNEQLQYMETNDGCDVKLVDTTDKVKDKKTN